LQLDQIEHVSRQAIAWAAEKLWSASAAKRNREIKTSMGYPRAHAV
jgi:hypothetical protein